MLSKSENVTNKVNLKSNYPKNQTFKIKPYSRILH